jgi:integrase
MPRQAPFRLTDRKVASLKTDRPKGQQFADSDLAGFGVTVFPTGRRVFWIRCRTPSGARKRIPIGRDRSITATEAREEAERILRRYERGGADVPTVAEWIDTYLAGVEKRKKRPADDRMYLGRAKARFGQRQLDEIRAEEVERAMGAVEQDVIARHQARIQAARAALDRARAERKPSEELEARVARLEAIRQPGRTAANRWLAAVRACFQAAWRAELTSENPAARVRKYREAPPRAVTLSESELTALEEAVAELGERGFVHAEAAFVLLLDTGARASEVLRARWEDFDLDRGLWRIPSSKSGRPQVVPLASQTANLLSTVLRFGAYVVPGETTDRPRHDLRAFWRGLKAAVAAKLTAQGLPTDHWGQVRIHDLRRTFGERVARTRGLHHASKLLRHGDVKVTEQVYAPLGIEDLRRTMEEIQRPRKARLAAAGGKVVFINRATREEKSS